MIDAWNKWKSLAKKVGNVQANILLTLVYILLIIPIGLLRIIFKRSRNNESSFWLKRPKIRQDLIWAKRQ